MQRPAGVALVGPAPEDETGRLRVG